MVTFTGAAAALTYGLIRANEDGWSPAGTWLWLVAAPVLLVVFLAVESRSPQPMLDLVLLRNRSFVGVLLAGLVLTFAAFASFTYTSIWLQSVLGLSPIEAGLTGLPLSLASFGVSAAIGRFLHGSRPGPIIGGGLLVIGVGGLVGGLLVHGDASWPALIPGFLLIGIGVGLATPTLSSAAMAAVPMQRGGMAAGAVNTARQLGFAFGIAALGSVFASRAEHVLADRGVPAAGGTARALAGGQAPVLLKSAPARFRDTLDPALHAAAVGGVQWTFLVSGIGGVLAGLAVLALIRPTPAPADAAVDAPAAAPAAAQPAEVAS
jgi:predicted MFS family arabinose efflux permease